MKRIKKKANKPAKINLETKGENLRMIFGFRAAPYVDHRKKHPMTSTAQTSQAGPKCAAAMIPK